MKGAIVEDLRVGSVVYDVSEKKAVIMDLDDFQCLNNYRLSNHPNTIYLAIGLSYHVLIRIDILSKCYLEVLNEVSFITPESIRYIHELQNLYRDIFGININIDLFVLTEIINYDRDQKR